jgi:hypothetical protein
MHPACRTSCRAWTWAAMSRWGFERLAAVERWAAVQLFAPAGRQMCGTPRSRQPKWRCGKGRTHVRAVRCSDGSAGRGHLRSRAASARSTVSGRRRDCHQAAASRGLRERLCFLCLFAALSFRRLLIQVSCSGHSPFIASPLLLNLPDSLAQVKNFKTYVKREIVHQSSLKHPFIVSLKEVTCSRLENVVTKCAPGGDMFKYICRHKPHCRLLESQARWIFQQLIIGLDYCHNKVLRDRTPCAAETCSTPHVWPQTQCTVLC